MKEMFISTTVESESYAQPQSYTEFPRSAGGSSSSSTSMQVQAQPHQSQCDQCTNTKRSADINVTEQMGILRTLLLVSSNNDVYLS